MRELQLGKLRYVVRYPKGYDKNKKYPVIIFLHGAGTRGNDISVLSSGGFFSITERYENFPFISIAPLCSENTWFDVWEQLKSLVEVIAQCPFVDNTRMYLMGGSMGGYATWQLAMSMPDYFAAIVPICGGGMYWNAGRLINVPVWAFHGAKDTTVLPEESVKMVDAINKLGGKAKLTIYQENGHDAWSDTFSNYNVFSWLLENQINNNLMHIDKYNNPQKHG